MELTVERRFSQPGAMAAAQHLDHRTVTMAAWIAQMMTTTIQGRKRHQGAIPKICRLVRRSNHRPNPTAFVHRAVTLQDLCLQEVPIVVPLDAR